MPDLYPDYFRFLILPLLLPLGAGIFILTNSWKDDVSRYIGFLSLKPVVAYPLWFVISWSTWFNKVYDNNPVLVAIVPLIPGIALTLIVIYFFRHLFGIDKFAWLFLLGDFLRWTNTFIFTAFIDSNIIFDAFVFLAIFGLCFPSVYAIVSVFAVKKRTAKKKEFAQISEIHG